MKLIFITTNKHKVQEVSLIMKSFNIDVIQENYDYVENHELGIHEIARQNAKLCAEKFQKPVCVEDTGLEFEAYPGFPGPLPKFVLKTLGFKGIFKLLKEESKKATFTAVVGYCEPGKESIIFEGELKGKFTEDVADIGDAFGYDPIFVINGQEKQVSFIPLEEKNKNSHRAKAFRKLGEYLTKKN